MQPEILATAERSSPEKSPLTVKIVSSYMDALINSDIIVNTKQKLKTMFTNGGNFVPYFSFHSGCPSYNNNTFRAIVAYSMLRKDFNLFNMISQAFFTGYVQEYMGSNLRPNLNVSMTDTNLYGALVPYGSLDENHITSMPLIDLKSTYASEYPPVYPASDTSLEVVIPIYDTVATTDGELYSDTSESGQIFEVFKNIYCEDPSFGYQSLKQLLEAEDYCGPFITLVKPARVTPLFMRVPYLYMSATKTYGVSVVSTPFIYPDQVDYLNNLSDEAVATLYKVCESVSVSFHFDRSVTGRKIRLEFKAIAARDSGESAWKPILIYSNDENVSDIQIQINSDVHQEMFNVYFAILEIEV